MSGRLWTEEEVQRLRAAYSATFSRGMRLAELAAELGRSLDSVHLKASRIGLGDFGRRKVEVRKVRVPMFDNDADRRAAQSEAAKRRIAENGHPRGALGMKHTPETLQRLSEASKQAWARPDSKLNSPEERQRRADNIYRGILAGRPIGTYSRGSSGKREDLGDRYFRSSWEANYARFLNFQLGRGEIGGWEYECKTFEFAGIKRGTRFYTPDFKVTKPDGSYEWHEVKGWMNQQSKTRLKRMAKYHPTEPIRIIGKDWFASANRAGLPNIIRNWERGGKKVVR